MRFAVVASALFAGLAVAAPAVTQTVHSTEVETITSCGVTNCPARLSSSTENTTAPAQQPQTVTLYSTKAVTISSCAPEVTNCPLRVSSSIVSVGTTGTAASTGFGASATSAHPSSYTGAAGKLNAGMALAGVAGFAALLI
ncbi:unnamed protein product [Aureobasidium vineae]|uniref:GPI anchored cell wall protein n=1 Tax=Aureobasidium vineae TaxID=2773715 RepID=A0A9N8JV29_9PEZI|nr:unnamed protein product [Aureobasidium vineae]